MQRMTFVAVCQFPGFDAFRFYSDTFAVAAWSDLEREGKAAVAEAWGKINPSLPPPVIDYLPGALVYEARL